MTDWLLAGCVYVPAWIVGRLIVDATGWDGFTVGWMVGGLALCLRMEGPQIIRAEKFRR